MSCRYCIALEVMLWFLILINLRLNWQQLYAVFNLVWYKWTVAHCRTTKKSQYTEEANQPILPLQVWSPLLNLPYYMNTITFKKISPIRGLTVDF